MEGDRSERSIHAKPRENPVCLLFPSGDNGDGPNILSRCMMARVEVHGIHKAPPCFFRMAGGVQGRSEVVEEEGAVVARLNRGIEILERTRKIPLRVPRFTATIETLGLEARLPPGLAIFAQAFRKTPHGDDPTFEFPVALVGAGRRGKSFMRGRGVNEAFDGHDGTRFEATSRQRYLHPIPAVFADAERRIGAFTRGSPTPLGERHERVIARAMTECRDKDAVFFRPREGLA